MRQNPVVDNGRHRMNLPDAPIANEGFFVTHFFTVRDQEKSKDLGLQVAHADVYTWVDASCGMTVSNLTPPRVSA